MRVVIALLLLISSLSFALGITLPILYVQKLYFFEETPSIISLIGALWEEGSTAIALAVAAFSILFPLVKLGIVFVSAVAPRTQLARSQAMQWASVLSKWSMMDVLLVAIVIVAAKTSAMADALVQPGLWFYATSALTGAIAASLLQSRFGARRKRA